MSSNLLIHESSPYLQQHAHNPVHWMPWGDAAFKKAKEEDKLVLISIGYSACHWCHVMEHESFEDEEVAEVMNKHFVCIKVDREERTDVDQVYMQAVQMLTGRGGWPLNCFALPDGRPVWGGTYFPKDQWVQSLNMLNDLYTNSRNKIFQQAETLTKGINQQEMPEMQMSLPKADMDAMVEKLAPDVDYEYGGFKPEPKFPMPVVLKFIHALGVQEKNEGLLRFFYFTLDRMALGGLYDQAGGGFARYSVDAKWFAPHFEKMLYDNAQLLSLYSEAYKSSGKLFYKSIVEQVFSFLEREMLAPDGTFYSALDADSEGVEGKFYTWTYAELEVLLGKDDDFFEYYNIQEKGNWEDGVNILHAEQSLEEFAAHKSLSVDELSNRFTKHLKILLAKRKERIRPGLDNKVLTSWNALAIKALCDAYQAFGDEKYLKRAESAMNTLLAKMETSSGKLYRSLKNETIGIDGFLEDYAFTIDALLSLYQVTFNEDYFGKAKSISEYVLKYFYDEGDGVFYYTASNGEQLIARKSDLQDNVIPSSVGAMVNNLIQLSQLEHNQEYESIAELLINKMRPQAEAHPKYYAQWAQLAFWQNQGREEVAILGDKADEFRTELQKKYQPNIVYAGSNDGGSSVELLKDRHREGRTLIYKCVNKSCQLPLSEPSGE